MYGLSLKLSLFWHLSIKTFLLHVIIFSYLLIVRLKILWIQTGLLEQNTLWIILTIENFSAWWKKKVFGQILSPGNRCYTSLQLYPGNNLNPAARRVNHITHTHTHTHTLTISNTNLTLTHTHTHTHTHKESYKSRLKHSPDCIFRFFRILKYLSFSAWWLPYKGGMKPLIAD